jgi:hypothetical protein
MGYPVAILDDKPWMTRLLLFDELLCFSSTLLIARMKRTSPKNVLEDEVRHK